MGERINPEWRKKGRIGPPRPTRGVEKNKRRATEDGRERLRQEYNLGPLWLRRLRMVVQELAGVKLESI